jgi:hypothetical protein
MGIYNRGAVLSRRQRHERLPPTKPTLARQPPVEEAAPSALLRLWHTRRKPACQTTGEREGELTAAVDKLPPPAVRSALSVHTACNTCCTQCNTCCTLLQNPPANSPTLASRGEFATHACVRVLPVRAHDRRGSGAAYLCGLLLFAEHRNTCSGGTVAHKSRPGPARDPLQVRVCILLETSQSKRLRASPFGAGWSQMPTEGMRGVSRIRLCG